jgi:hypothetical protein
VEHDVWTLSWKGHVVAVGTGLPPHAEAPLKVEVARWRRPPPASTWGVPDWHFVKIATLCAMVFGATILLIRERIAELAIHEPGLLVYEPPRPVAFAPVGAWRGPLKESSPISPAAIQRIQRFRLKLAAVQAWQARPAFPQPVASRGLLRILGSAPGTDVAMLASLSAPSHLSAFRAVGDEEGGIEGGVVGGVIGGVVGGRAEADLAEARPRRRFDDAESRRLIKSVHVADCLGDHDANVMSLLRVHDDGSVNVLTVRGVTGSEKDCVTKLVAALRFAPGEGEGTLTARWNVE